ncbi:hypothetical protein [Hoyosella subflava]|uniref:SGNH hydrolase-type esterase domain-containing protein n=1 Tax=Hoyosella subflava (strain DSM 45089 / JCM 17490 / NBRC 109087 / DQS3-9A1) TaxID=443218 RepID=F6EHF5_HOYSD|nr:hypothetical protein [Hoyosella subflava]AEF41134.1 hypothetical protein AS9A_2687 [Hoyosella subflava DQS3-9A1]
MRSARTGMASVVSVLAMVLMLLAPAQAAALERPADKIFYDEQEGGADAPGGLYVIGDSISVDVPYLEVGEEQGLRVWVRYQAGWSAFAHRTSKWCSPEPFCQPQTSVSAAAQSDASTVFVQLGTNDIRCLRPDPLCAPYLPPLSPEQRDAERSLIAAETLAVAKTLIDAGKCVVWAGPREVAGDTWLADDAAAMNGWLRALEKVFPGNFYYADYHALSFADEALLTSLDNPWAHPDADRVHPRSVEGRQAIAEFAVSTAVSQCGAGLAR